MKLSEIKQNVSPELLNILKNKVNIVGLSGGKDSVATCILLYYLDIPFKTLTAEVWYRENITGEHPEHFDFLHNTLFPKLDLWGIEHHTVRSKITAYDYMTTPIKASKEHPERNGKYRGFVLCGKCGIQRDCKIRPCQKYYGEIQEPYNSILGLASNEKDRALSANSKNKIALLNELKIHEGLTFPICKGENLLSPTYLFSNRGGCWFCPNQKIQELELLYRKYPEHWNELMQIQKMPNKVTELFNRTQTLYDIENEIQRGVQMKFFMGDLTSSIVVEKG